MSGVSDNASDIRSEVPPLGGEKSHATNGLDLQSLKSSTTDAIVQKFPYGNSTLIYYSSIKEKSPRLEALGKI